MIKFSPRDTLKPLTTNMKTVLKTCSTPSPTYDTCLRSASTAARVACRETSGTPRMQVHRRWAEALHNDMEITDRPRNKFMNTHIGTNLYRATAAQLEKTSLLHPFLNWPSSSILRFSGGVALDRLHLSRHICKYFLFEQETCRIWGSHCSEWRGSRFCLLQIVRTGPEAHPTSFRWVSGFAPAGQVARAWS